jgi:hypothetical protein
VFAKAVEVPAASIGKISRRLNWNIKEEIFGERVSRRAPAERLKKQGKRAKSSE